MNRRASAQLPIDSCTVSAQAGDDRQAAGSLTGWLGHDTRRRNNIPVELRAQTCAEGYGCAGSASCRCVGAGASPRSAGEHHH